MTEPSKIETTYADLRPTDLVIDKAGKAWPLGKDFEDGGSVLRFWLLEPVTKVKAHFITRPKTDPVTVSRVPTHADEAAKLEADFPVTDHYFEAFDGSSGMVCTRLVHDSDGFGTDCGRPASEHALQVAEVEHEADEAAKLEADVTDAETLAAVAASDNFVSLEEAVAAVEAIGGTVEAEVTAEEVDAANAATEDAPVTLPLFEDMTPLERRSHLYLLHGTYCTDVQSMDTLSTWHQQLHSPTNEIKSKVIPHVHAALMGAKNNG